MTSSFSSASVAPAADATAEYRGGTRSSWPRTPSTELGTGAAVDVLRVVVEPVEAGDIVRRAKS